MIRNTYLYNDARDIYTLRDRNGYRTVTVGIIDGYLYQLNVHGVFQVVYPYITGNDSKKLCDEALQLKRLSLPYGWK